MSVACSIDSSLLLHARSAPLYDESGLKSGGLVAINPVYAVNNSQATPMMPGDRLMPGYATAAGGASPASPGANGVARYDESGIAAAAATNSNQQPNYAAGGAVANGGSTLSFVCASCNKAYNSQRDLRTHQEARGHLPVGASGANDIALQPTSYGQPGYGCCLFVCLLFSLARPSRRRSGSIKAGDAASYHGAKQGYANADARGMMSAYDATTASAMYPGAGGANDAYLSAAFVPDVALDDDPPMKALF